MNEKFPLGTAPQDDPVGCEEEGGPIRCKAGRSAFWVTWQGQMQACGMFPSEGMPNVFELGFDEAWKRTADYAAKIRMPAKCELCELKNVCRPCAAMCKTETGEFGRVPAYRCAMFGAYPEARRALAKELKTYE